MKSVVPATVIISAEPSTPAGSKRSQSQPITYTMKPWELRQRWKPTCYTKTWRAFNDHSTPGSTRLSCQRRIALLQRKHGQTLCACTHLCGLREVERPQTAV